MSLLQPARHPPERTRKFRQAAIVYLHYALLYLFGAQALLDRGLFPSTRGPESMWFAIGMVIAAIVIWGLWHWQNVWFARVVWALVAFKLPTMIKGAFLGSAMEIDPALYAAAGVVLLIVMWALARAAWDV